MGLLNFSVDCIFHFNADIYLVSVWYGKARVRSKCVWAEFKELSRDCTCCVPLYIL